MRTVAIALLTLFIGGAIGFVTGVILAAANRSDDTDPLDEMWHS